MVSGSDPISGRGSSEICRAFFAVSLIFVRILFDQGVPVPLRKQLTSHEVTTCKEKGWDQITNGDLITQAETLFDVFVSTDQNLKYQQNFKNRKIAILILPTTSWRKLQQNAATIKSALDTLKLGQYLEISF